MTLQLNLQPINLTFDKVLHVYTLDGRWVPSVTGVLGMLPKDWLAPWASKLACESIAKEWKADKKYSKEDIAKILDSAKAAHRIRKEVAGVTGTDIHELIKKHIDGESFATLEDKETLNAWNQFLAWEEKTKPEYLASEVMLASNKLQVAGTCDAVAKINGDLTVIDWKSSKQISSEYAIQLAAYQYMLIELGVNPTEIKNRLILRLPKEGGEYEAVIVKSNYEEDMEIFRAALKIYPWHKNNEKYYRLKKS